MVLESLIKPEKAENKKYLVLGLGFIFTLVAALLTHILTNFQEESGAGLMLVFFTTIPSIPLMYSVIKYEEKKDLSNHSEKWLLKEHGKALASFMYLFIGIVLGMVLLYLVLPSSSAENLFGEQLDTLRNIQQSMETGMGTGFSIGNFDDFSRIFFHNLKVLMLSVIFSFLFGAGAIFILAWNASVIAAAIGNFITNQLKHVSELVGFERVAGYFEVFTIGLFMYSIHGIPEILAYFTAALAGGIISIAIIRHDYKSEKFEKIILDSADLLLISIGLLFVAGLLEVYVTPLVFS